MARKELSPYAPDRWIRELNRRYPSLWNDLRKGYADPVRILRPGRGGIELLANIPDWCIMPTLFPFLDIFKGALLQHGMKYVTQMMQERFGFDGSSRLNPGSLPDWPIGNNFALFDMIGGLDEIGVTLNAAGYIHPWNSASQIHFPGNGYENCSLCKKYDCIRRRAPFDRAEYRRVFGINP